MSRLIVITIILFMFFSCSNKLKNGFYEPKKSVNLMDDKIGKISVNDFIAISQNLNIGQIERLNEIIYNKEYHEQTDLGTCEISGIFVLDDKTIYLTCGTSQIFISEKNHTYNILLTKSGNDKLFSLVQNIKNE